MDEQNILYFYMTRRFEKFTGADFARNSFGMRKNSFRTAETYINHHEG